MQKRYSFIWMKSLPQNYVNDPNIESKGFLAPCYRP